MPPPSKAELLLAYRHLYKASLRAVQYSVPSRYQARDQIRDGFRRSAASDFDPVKIQRTIEFLDNAARTKGLEHKIMKNLTIVWYWRKRSPLHYTNRSDKLPFKPYAYDDFDRVLGKLNETMNLCLRCGPP